MTITTHLYPLPPYNFHQSALIFAHGNPQIRTYQNGVFSMTLMIEKTPVRIQLWSRGTIPNPVLHLEITSEETISPHMKDNVEKVVNDIFNLQEDISPMYQDFEDDPDIKPLIEELYGLRSPTTLTVFEALVDTIIEQQISLSVAYTLEDRLIIKTGKTLNLDNQPHYCYPTPDILATIPIEVFRSCGLTTRKSEYIRDISMKILHGEIDLENMKLMNDTKEIIDILCTFRGIGRWSAELILLRGFHRYDAFPAADIALRRMIGERFCGGRKISAEDAQEIAHTWGRWKGLISFYLEVADRVKKYPESSHQFSD